MLLSMLQETRDDNLTVNFSFAPSQASALSMMSAVKPLSVLSFEALYIKYLVANIRDTFES